MQCELYVPSAGEAKLLKMKSFWWIYGRGEEIINRYGNKFGIEVKPYGYYFGYYVGEEINEDNLEEFVLLSNKWNYNSPKKEDKFIGEDGWKHAVKTYRSVGKPVNIAGHKCIPAMPFGRKCAIVYDTDIEDMVIIPHYKYRYNSELADIFEKVVAIYGELDQYYGIKNDVEWKLLNTTPCGEFASHVSAEYCIVYGWQISKMLKYKDKDEKYNNIAKYICIRIDNNESDDKSKGKLYVISNKWRYSNHSKKDDWMLEDNSIIKMWRDRSYSGRPCMINGKKCIIVYPFNIYNPVIWVTDTDQVFVMPAKAYPGNIYYNKIKEALGNIPVYQE